MADLRRRDFVRLLGGAVAAWPLTAGAQSADRLRRVGVQLNLEKGDPEGLPYVAAFEQTLAQLGWVVGRTVQLDYRWTAGNAARIRQTAAEMLALNPDVIMTVGGSQVGPLQELTSTVPIVFVQVADPVGGGFVDSLARPGRNATGFTVFEYGIGGKWVELIKEVAPSVTRVGMLRDLTNPAGTGLFGAAQTVAPSLGVEVSPIGLRGAAEIERGIEAFARQPNGGLIVTPSSLSIVNRELIVGLAGRHRLPALYPFRYFVTGGGLVSYGPDVVEQYRQAAGYVDRILRGKNPAELPVQAARKYQLVVNLKAARTLGLVVPAKLLARADEAIQ
jgi:putative ABC transport system substrate-binding protein